MTLVLLVIRLGFGSPRTVPSLIMICVCSSEGGQNFSGAKAVACLETVEERLVDPPEVLAMISRSSIVGAVS